MAPTKGSHSWQGKRPSCPGQMRSSKRVALVKAGKASWVEIQRYSPEEALRKAGIPL
jgi:hypothetical protein